MEEKLLESLIKRPGLSGQIDVLKDLIHDCVSELKSLLNYEEDEELPEDCKGAAKDFVLLRFNQDGTQGIQSESQSSGGSVTYIDALPDSVKRAVRRHRRFRRRCGHVNQ